MIRSCLVRASFYPRLLKGFEPSVSSLTKYTQQFNTKFYTTAAIGVQKFLGDGGLLVPTLPTSTQQPSREYAARRGTRAKRDKLKVKKVVEKKSFQTKRLRKLERWGYGDFMYPKFRITNSMKARLDVLYHISMF